MASTLLAVDDSVTMRKVLEITFAGQDFRVVTVSSPDAALQKLKSEKPDLVIADGTLEPNGYELCKAIKKASPATPVLLLSSKQNAFDAAKAGAASLGAAAGAGSRAAAKGESSPPTRVCASGEGAGLAAPPAGAAPGGAAPPPAGGGL